VVFLQLGTTDLDLFFTDAVYALYDICRYAPGYGCCSEAGMGDKWMKGGQYGWNNEG